MLQYMLDTNICIYVLKSCPEQLRERFNRLAGQALHFYDYPRRTVVRSRKIIPSG